MSGTSVLAINASGLLTILRGPVSSDSSVALLLGALIAAFGYVGKLLAEMYLDWRRRGVERHARLLRLSSLLSASYVSFQIQREQRDRLAEMLRQNHPGSEAQTEGYEALFSGLYSQMTPEEIQLHSIIRGITLHALHPINEEISRWLAAEIEFRATSGHASTSRQQLAEKLNVLAAHLLLWHAKYETWIPSHPERALVYMADEQEHGLGFPQGLDDLVRAVSQNRA